MVTSTVDAFVPDVRKPPLVFVVFFVVFGMSPSSCLLEGISRVSALFACTWYNMVGLDSCASDGLLLHSSNK